MPARLKKNKYKEVLYLANKAHKVLECKGLPDQILNSLKTNFIFLS